MYKLGALDAGFLYNESERCPQHIASVQVLELPEGISAAEFVDNLKTLLMARIHLVPYFTNKLQFVPFNLDHPIWVKDTGFDINQHVKTIEVPAPGGQLEMEQTIAGLHETRLDRSRPLWDLWVLTGLEGGRVAYYNRAHHACLDGVAAQAMLETIMDLGPQPRVVEPPPSGFFATEKPENPVQLLTGAVENFLKFQARQPAAMLSAVDTAARLFQRALDPNKGLGAAAATAPATRFNKAIEKKRRYAVGDMPLTSVKAIAKVTHTKINDVFLAACASGIRRYLERTNELPETAMIAGCPVSLRRADDASTNNQVTMMMVSMATNEADPAERLQKIAASTRTAKGLTRDIAPSYDTDVAVPGLPATLQSGLRVAEEGGLANLPGLRLPCNVVVSNVPGPQVRLYSCGARVLTHYPVSIAAHTQGVNITVQSYDGALYFAITACARALPDAQRLRDDILAGYEELKALYDPPSVPVALQQREAEKALPVAVKEQVTEANAQPRAA